VTQGLDSPYYRAIVRAMVTWGREVGATICAEGVETESQRRVLREIGVHKAQGYLFGRPVTSTSPVLTTSDVGV
jgi:EAL domain-containing protein (putative c-di-GMP-specific phosphodiesterase class I)